MVRNWFWWVLIGLDGSWWVLMGFDGFWWGFNWFVSKVGKPTLTLVIYSRWLSSSTWDGPSRWHVACNPSRRATRIPRPPFQSSLHRHRSPVKPLSWPPWSISTAITRWFPRTPATMADFARPLEYSRPQSPSAMLPSKIISRRTFRWD